MRAARKGVCLIVAMPLLACGGGGGGGGSVGGGGGSGGGPAPTDFGLWTGTGCCVRLDPFPVAGITSDSGDYRFLVLGRHYVGKLGAGQTTYATCDSCLAGAPVADPHDFRLLDIVAHTLVAARVVEPNPFSADPPTLMFNFDVPYDRSFEQSSSTAKLQGVYTTNLGTGYTLTIAVDAAGQVNGTDTNGCNLAGSILTGHPSINYYDAVLDVSSCGNVNGRYPGNATLIFDDNGRATALFLSVSNANAAIGWQLDR